MVFPTVVFLASWTYVSRFLALPMELRLVVLFVGGAAAGGFANWAAYSLGYRNPRPLSPWARAYPRRGLPLWLDRVPVFGWLRERPAGKLFQAASWLRPMIVELGLGLAFAALYVWEIGQLQNSFLLQATPLNPELAVALHLQFVGKALLLTLMTAISLIDLDERTIPDALTIPGTLLGLAWAVLTKRSALLDPGFSWLLVDKPTVSMPQMLWLSTPRDWPALLDSFWGLTLAWATTAAWCVGLLPRTWYSRHGSWRALQLCWARVRRESVSVAIGAMGLVVAGGAGGAWLLGGELWRALLSAMVGLLIGGALVWAIRILGTLALNREAMGFGDVILLAMIGAWLGWQPVLFAFFLAPFGGMIMGLANYLLRGEHELPYGPFLCCGTALTVLYWQPLWNWARPVFQYSELVGGSLVACLVFCGVLLRIVRAVRGY